jgi:ABC-2 type transport system permease protein
MIRRYLAVLKTRNLEFLRDRAALGWNVALPVFIVVGMWLIFSGGQKPLFKVAVLNGNTAIASIDVAFLKTRYVDFYPVDDETATESKVAHNQIDMLMDLRDTKASRYWVNETSPKGYILEKILAGETDTHYARATVSGRAINYVDWLVPGVLGMNMMFSCLFGVGYVIVRYRKSGFLKRLNATPLKAFEFIAAQVSSRLLLIMSVTTLVFIGTYWLVGFYMAGNYLLLLLTAVLGAVCMISLGLLVAARVASEEFAGGLLNLASWPMMFLSGVWFSLEGSPMWIQDVAKIFPLTQMLDAARKVMLDGAGLATIWPQLLSMACMSALFLALGSFGFKWKNE